MRGNKWSFHNIFQGLFNLRQIYSGGSSYGAPSYAGWLSDYTLVTPHNTHPDHCSDPGTSMAATLQPPVLLSLTDRCNTWTRTLMSSLIQHFHSRLEKDLKSRLGCLLAGDSAASRNDSHLNLIIHLII